MSRHNHRTGAAPAEFHLDKGNATFLGVCAGLGRYLGIDRTVVRIGFAIGALCSLGTFILIYLAIALLAD